MLRLRRLLAASVLASCLAGCGSGADPADQRGTGAVDPAGAPAEAGSTDVAGSSTPTADPAAAAVEVTPVTPDELKQRIAGDKGKAVLVDFWATWCVPCRKEYPHTVELSKKHAGDLVVYSVNMDETDEESLVAVKEFLAKHADGNVQTLQSAEGGAEEAYTAFEIAGGALPHYKVFGRDGEVVQTFGGDVDVTVEPEQIDAAVAKAIGG